MWLQALAALATWDDGVDGAFLVNFSVPDDPADGAAMGRCCTIPTTAVQDLSLTRAAGPVPGSLPSNGLRSLKLDNLL